MTHGRETVGDGGDVIEPRRRALTPFDDPEPVEVVEEPDPGERAIDPWGAQDPRAFAPRREGVFAHSRVEDDEEEEADEAPVARRRGGGILTIPLLCVGVAVIACVTLLPIADENHQLAWERLKLQADLNQLQEQARVNEEFLKRVADDPTLAERLANRQMKYIREGTSVLPLRGGGREEMSPFHLVSVPPPAPIPPYQPVGGALATLVRQPRAQLYLCGGALLMIASGLILGYVPKARLGDDE